MKKEGDDRIGPWYGSVHEVLDQRARTANGECLYFVTNADGELKYIGESKNRLGDRWKMPPAVCAVTGRKLGNPFFFHNRAWQRIERELLTDDARTSAFSVSVLRGPALYAAVDETPGLSQLKHTGNQKIHLAKRVEQWFCGRPSLQAELWNIEGTGRRRGSQARHQSGRIKIQKANADV